MISYANKKLCWGWMIVKESRNTLVGRQNGEHATHQGFPQCRSQRARVFVTNQIPGFFYIRHRARCSRAHIERSSAASAHFPRMHCGGLPIKRYSRRTRHSWEFAGSSYIYLTGLRLDSHAAWGSAVSRHSSVWWDQPRKPSVQNALYTFLANSALLFFDDSIWHCRFNPGMLHASIVRGCLLCHQQC